VTENNTQPSVQNLSAPQPQNNQKLAPSKLQQQIIALQTQTNNVNLANANLQKEIKNTDAKAAAKKPSKATNAKNAAQTYQTQNTATPN
jgi:hypothetical protein